MCEYHIQKVLSYIKFKRNAERRSIEQIELYIRTTNNEKKSIEAKIEKLNAELDELKKNMANAQSRLMKHNANVNEYDSTIETLKKLINN